MNSFNPEIQLKDTKSVIKNKLQKLWSKLRGFKFVTTLALVFKMKGSQDKTTYDNFYLSLRAETIINDIDDVLQSICSTIVTNIQKFLGIIDSVIDHTISVWNINPLVGSSYLKLLKKLDHPGKGLINIQNINDNEHFKWTVVRYLNPADHNPAKLPKTYKDFAKKDFILTT